MQNKQIYVAVQLIPTLRGFIRVVVRVEKVVKEREHLFQPNVKVWSRGLQLKVLNTVNEMMGLGKAAPHRLFPIAGSLRT